MDLIIETVNERYISSSSFEGQQTVTYSVPPEPPEWVDGWIFLHAEGSGAHAGLLVSGQSTWIFLKGWCTRRGSDRAVNACFNQFNEFVESHGGTDDVKLVVCSPSAEDKEFVKAFPGCYTANTKDLVAPKGLRSVTLDLRTLDVTY